MVAERVRVAQPEAFGDGLPGEKEFFCDFVRFHHMEGLGDGFGLVHAGFGW